MAFEDDLPPAALRVLSELLSLSKADRLDVLAWGWVLEGALRAASNSNEATACPSVPGGKVLPFRVDKIDSTISSD
jgi:hypothetical protein